MKFWILKHVLNDFLFSSIQVRRNRHAGNCWRSWGELISDVLLWTPTCGRAKAERPARTYIEQLCEYTGCSPEEELPEAMNDREKWRERVRDIHVYSTTWRWWWYIYACVCVSVCVLICRRGSWKFHRPDKKWMVFRWINGTYKDKYENYQLWSIGIMVRVFVNSPGDVCSSHTKTQKKWLLNTQQY